jgi:hypothetical protein
MPTILLQRIRGIFISLICSNMRERDWILMAQSNPKNRLPVFVDLVVRG